MADELLQRREALRSLDWRLSAISTDIEHISEYVNDVRIGAAPLSRRSNTGTPEDEARVRGELIEIAAQLRTLTSRTIPDVGEEAGWKVTMRARIPGLRDQAQHMQAIVREAFAELEAQLPDNVPSQPLGDLVPYEDEVPGDNRRRIANALTAGFILCIIGVFVWAGLTDMDALVRACAHPSACASDEPKILLSRTREIVVEQREADCETRVFLRFDKNGRYSSTLPPHWDWTSDRRYKTASCSNLGSLRWMMFSKQQR